MRSSQKITFLTNQAADSAAFLVNLGGQYFWFVQATWVGGDSLKMQILLPDGTTYGDIDGAVLSANGMMKLDLPEGCSVKVVRVNGPPTAIYSTLVSGNLN